MDDDITLEITPDHSPTPYVIYDDTGLITQSGVCPASDIQLQASPGRSILVGCGKSALNYVSDGVIATYSQEELQEKNNLAQGWIWKMPERIAVDMRRLDEARAQAWTRIKKIRAEQDALPINCDGTIYDANPGKIQGQVQMALLSRLSNTPYAVEWTLSDNSSKTLNANDMLALGKALQDRSDEIHNTARLTRESINACMTNADADAIIWPLDKGRK